MREIVLRHFFDGRATAADLARDVSGSVDRSEPPGGPAVSRVRIRDMPGEFPVEPRHVLQLLDAVDAGALDLDALDAICFCLEASDAFIRDADTREGERVARGLFLLGSPEVNYPLTPRVLAKVRHLLSTGEDTFDRTDLRPPGPRPRLLSVNHKDPDRAV